MLSHHRLCLNGSCIFCAVSSLVTVVICCTITVFNSVTFSVLLYITVSCIFIYILNDNFKIWIWTRIMWLIFLLLVKSFELVVFGITVCALKIKDFLMLIVYFLFRSFLLMYSVIVCVFISFRTNVYPFHLCFYSLMYITDNLFKVSYLKL